MTAEAWYTALLTALILSDAEGDETALDTVIQEYKLDLTTLAALKVRSAEFYYDQPGEAARIARAALALGLRLPPPGAALGRWILANALLFNDHYQEAALLFDQARAEYLALDMPLEAVRLSVGQIWALAYLGDFDRALALAEKTAPVLAASDDPSDRKRLGGVYNNLGILYDLLGQYEEALAAYDHKLALLEPDNVTLEHARVQHNRGCVLTYLNAIDEAWAAFQLAEMGFRAANARSDVARLMLNRALLLALWHRYTEAEAALREAAELLAGLEGMEQQHHALRVYQALARLRGGLPLGGELCAELQTAQRALAQHGPVFEEALAWLGLGYGALEQAQWDEARQAFARVAQLAEKGAGQPLYYLAEEGLARLAQAQVRVNEAIAHYEAAIQHVETLRRDLQVATFSAGFLTDKLSLYQALIALYLQTDQPERAFATVERAKSRALVEQLAGRLREDLAHLTETPNAETAALVEALQATLYALETQYAQIRQADFAERGERWLPAIAPMALEELHKLELQAQQLTRQLQRRQPRFSAWATGYNAPLTEVQTVLKPGEALLQYAVVCEEVWGFVVDADGLRAQRCLGALAEIETVRRKWTAAVERVLGLTAQHQPALLKRYLPALLVDAEAHLAELYDDLVRPLIDVLTSVRTVLIAPDGPLYYVPFHALLNTHTSPATYLLERYTVSYVPSATALALSARGGRAGAGMLLVGYSGEHLAHVDAEIALLEELFPQARVLTGVQARARQVTEAAPDYRLIHIASHARFRMDNVLLSAFTLADRRLTLAEITRLRLEAELVTLSGCETGRGRLHGADMIGLASGFLAAGARSLLVSLWRVDDRATASLMRGFYQALRTGKGRAAALREAQLALLNSGRTDSDTPGLYRHPAYWAPFVLVGAWGALPLC